MLTENAITNLYESAVANDSYVLVWDSVSEHVQHVFSTACKCAGTFLIHVYNYYSAVSTY
jgi:hypothetical protein